MKEDSMTFAELYEACAGRLQGRTWHLQVGAGSYKTVEWQIYVADLVPAFATSPIPERALALLDTALDCEKRGISTESVPSEIGKIEVNPWCELARQAGGKLCRPCWRIVYVNKPKKAQWVTR